MSPFQDVRVRQAVNYAVDREELVNAVYYGYARPTCLPLMPHDLGYTTKKYFPDKADLTKAQELLDDAGYSEGFETTVITPSASALKREIEVIQAQLAKVKITLNIDMFDMGAWVSKYWIPPEEKQFIISHGDVDRVTDDSDSGLWWFYYPETIGWTGLDSPDAAKLLEDARTAVDKNVRHQLYLQILDIVIPLITITATNFATLLGGAIIIEEIFALPGVGRLLLRSILYRDFPTMQGIAVFMALVYTLVNMLADILYGVVDPRIRIE